VYPPSAEISTIANYSVIGLTHRFPLLVEALARLRARSCIIDGEAVACGEDGIALFERIR
jgi:ATP-dependent DNA ligase